MLATPVSLYFGVKKGEQASLEAVAKAAVEWAEAVRELAAFIEPGLEFRLEFVQSEDGSIWLRNLIKALKQGDPRALKAVAYSILIFFALGPALHLQADFGDKVLEWLGHEDDASISDEDKADIARRVIEAMQASNLSERRRAIVNHVENDSSITAIGVDYEPRPEGPAVYIPREQFPAFGARVDDDVVLPPPEKTTKFEMGIDVVIVRANLRETDAKPRWRFDQAGEEWSADIEDGEFVWALRNDKTGLSLAMGKHMKIDLAIDYRLDGGSLTEENRRVIRVIDPNLTRRQGQLL